MSINTKYYDIYIKSYRKLKYWLYPYNIRNRFDSSIKRRIQQFSLPGYEYGIVGVIEKVFKCKISGDVNISASIVSDYDRSELKVYSKFKTILYDKLNLKVFIETLDFVETCMGLKNFKYREFSNEEVINRLPSNSNSCYPLYLKKSDPKAINNVLLTYHKYINSTFENRYKLILSGITTIFHRFRPKIQEINGVKFNKFGVRQIWGVPYIIVFLEGKFLYSILDQFKESMSNYYSSGRTKLEISLMVKKVRETAKLKDKYIMCGDIKGCDKSVPLCFFVILHGLWDKCDCIPKYVKNHIKLILKYLSMTPYFDVEQKLKYTHGSTVSGSLLTSLFNTFVVFFSLCYIYKLKNNRFPEIGEIIVQGDDFLILIDNPKQAEVIKENMKIFNLRLNLTETSFVNYRQEIDFLGFKWSYDNEPDQTDDWLISRIVFPENFINIPGPDRVISRYLSLIFQIKRYFKLFKLFRQYDSYMRKKFSPGGDHKLFIIDTNGRIHENTVPISKLLTFGWKMF